MTMGAFREKLIKFMYGRYGIDHLYYALALLCFILLIINSFVHSPVLTIIMWFVFIVMISRTFSKNIYKRRLENERFLNAWYRVKKEWLFTIRRIKEIRTHRYHRCPHCKAMLRLPYKRGKHTVQCPRCNNEFKMRVII
ncbi:Zn-finger containing protein [Thermoclostridium stercorarium subsp. stercorarium DSM 8532]|uniref:Zn-finger containing protein n=3 Tax=Thermoclostridium stercorarium TaxID=1510 RepID=L7VT22_THES1|nr:Zn-finger containing protein [Thermoclostridium stercorarium subsp. stercorarium DSM 8532]